MKKITLIISALFLMTAAVSANSGNPGEASKKHLGIATYSVKGLESDIEGSLKSLADDGYTVVEISNYNNGTVAGYKPAEYAALAKKYGLTIISSHARAKFDAKDPDGTVAAWAKVFDDHKTMGCKYVIFPMNFWSNKVETLKQECDLMNRIGDEANKRGLKFGYHNHSMEFAKVPGTDQYFEDYLIENTDPEKVFFQLDVYWAKVGGQDPAEYLKKHPDRIKVLHIKDEYVIGESGTMDYKPIFTQFYKNGYKDCFVEIEGKMTPEQRKQSMAMMENMKKMMEQGGGNPFGGGGQQGRPQGAPQGQPQAQPQGAPQGQPQGASQGQPQRGTPAAMPGMGPRDPKVVAEQLKTSLEAIKLSADFLEKADYVK